MSPEDSHGPGPIVGDLGRQGGIRTGPVLTGLGEKSQKEGVTIWSRTHPNGGVQDAVATQHPPSHSSQTLLRPVGSCGPTEETASLGPGSFRSDSVIGRQIPTQDSPEPCPQAEPSPNLSPSYLQNLPFLALLLKSLPFTSFYSLPPELHYVFRFSRRMAPHPSPSSTCSCLSAGSPTSFRPSFPSLWLETLPGGLCPPAQH